MYDKHILTDEGARSIWEDGKKVGYCVNLKINYYRGLPLCCVGHAGRTRGTVRMTTVIVHQARGLIKAGVSVRGKEKERPPCGGPSFRSD